MQFLQVGGQYLYRFYCLVRFPCYFGIDTPHRRDLISNGNSVSELCASLGADSLAFISVEGLLEALDGEKRYAPEGQSSAHAKKPAGTQPDGSLLPGLLYRGVSDSGPRRNQLRAPAYGIQSIVRVFAAAHTGESGG